MLLRRQQRLRRKRLKRLLKLTMFLLLVMIGIAVLHDHTKTNILAISTQHVLSDTASHLSSPTNAQALTPSTGSTGSLFPTSSGSSTETPISENNSSQLGNAIQNALTGTTGTYGIVVKNLKTGESYYSNDHREYESGSLYKLWVMAVVYQQIKQGNLHGKDVLSDSVQNLNKTFSIDPDSAEQTGGTITYSVNDALTQMITISDNYAALLLTEKIGLSNVAIFLKNNGFNESKVGTDGKPPLTTPADIALFFEKLYKGQLANQEYTNDMIQLLKWQKLNEKIPEYLPDGVVVAHKTGELDDFSHDAGIVFSPSGDYIIVVLSESDDPLQANERIADASQAVYQYFND